jgi:hypothetical protein
MSKPRAIQWIKATSEGIRKMLCLVCDKEYDLRAKYCGLHSAALVHLKEATPVIEQSKKYQEFFELWPSSGRSFIFRE